MKAAFSPQSEDNILFGPPHRSTCWRGTLKPRFVFLPPEFKLLLVQDYLCHRLLNLSVSPPTPPLRALLDVHRSLPRFGWKLMPGG